MSSWRREHLIKLGIRFPQDYALTELTERTVIRGPASHSFGEHGISATLAIGSAVLSGATPAAAIGAARGFLGQRLGTFRHALLRA
jgi:hypothetical protein